MPLFLNLEKNMKIQLIISTILFILLSACGGSGNEDKGGVKEGKKLYDFTSSTNANYYNPTFVIAGDTGTLLSKSFKGLPIIHKSHTPEVCTISGNTLSFIEFTSDVYNKTKECKFTTHSDGTEAIAAFTTPKRVIVVRPKCITNERYNYKGICVSSLASMTNPEPQQYLVKGKKSAMQLKQANIKLDTNSNPIVTVQTTPANSCQSAPAAQGYASPDGYFRLICTPQQIGEITFTINYQDADDNNFTDDFKITVKADTGVKPIVAVSKTGVTTCSTDSGSSAACNSSNGLGQDGSLQKGTDVTYQLHTAANGDECVKDVTNGKFWEQKTNDGSLRDVKWTYAWYNLNGAQNKGYVGKKTTNPAAVCHSSLNDDCTTLAYINKLNALNYCGKNNWRLPTFFELVNLLDLSKDSTTRDASNAGMPAVFTYNSKKGPVRPCPWCPPDPNKLEYKNTPYASNHIYASDDPRGIDSYLHVSLMDMGYFSIDFRTHIRAISD